MDFRVNLTVEVDQVANALAIRTPVPISLEFSGKRWRAECEKPPVETPDFDTMEEALIAGASQVAAELQAAVNDRPLIVARITPDNIPANLFR